MCQRRSAQCFFFRRMTDFDIFELYANFKNSRDRTFVGFVNDLENDEFKENTDVDFDENNEEGQTEVN